MRGVLRAHGIHYALANTGEFAALSHKPEGENWRVGIQHPRVPEAYVALAALDDRFPTPFSLCARIPSAILQPLDKANEYR